MEKKELIESYFGKVRTLKEGMMEYLIELVYQYNKEKDGEKIGLITSVKDGDYEVGFDKEKEIRKYENYIISKQFGFIKWLVDNDKISKKKIDEVERKPLYVTDDMFSLYELDECILMLLSISDNPISDLCSYLK